LAKQPSIAFTLPILVTSTTLSAREGTRYVTNVIPEQVTVISRHRWEDYGLTNAPSVEELR
jgi:hypothetical protein